MEFTCPFCHGHFKFTDPRIKTIHDAEGATCDCPHCGKVLLAEDGVFKDAYKVFFDGYDVKPDQVGRIDIPMGSTPEDEILA